MKKILKIRCELLEILVPEMIPLIFLDDKLFEKGWVYSNYLKLTLTKKDILAYYENKFFIVNSYTNIFFENIFFPDEQILISADYDIPIKGDNAVNVSEKFLCDTLIMFINSQNYLLGTLDNKIVNTEIEYRKFVIYGYDDVEKIFYIVAHSNNQYKLTTIGIDILFDSLAQQFDESKKGYCLINCYKINPFFNGAFDINKIVVMLSEYITMNINEIPKNNFCIEDVRNYVIKKVRDDSINENFILSVNTIYSHLCFMYERINYFIEKNAVSELDKNQLLKINKLVPEFKKIMSDFEIDKTYTINERIRLCEKIDCFFGVERDIIITLIACLREAVI